ncbi:adhesive plaque matrix protein-like [Danaus plexippus]|uniref:adhesive plaque matrix protein-like n=1 Tax=Danaus plexippus TaxID=13037 RepID=UPI002AB1331C|nr:adhesive plaque matrix protein-like [Danaus plexippus]
MQLSGAPRYLLLATVFAASQVYTQGQTHNLLEENLEKRLSKREAAIFIDNFPIIPISRQAPDVVYRKISKKRYRNPKPKYGPPSYKYRSTKPSKSIKKYRRPVKSKYGPPSYKKRPVRTNYGPPKPTYKPVYGPPKKIPYSYYAAEPSFREAAQDFRPNYQHTKQSFGEPPIDSYVAPPNTAVEDSYNQYSLTNSNSRPLSGYGGTGASDHEYGSWQNYQSDQDFDNTFDYSKKHSVFVKPETFVKPDTEYDLTSYGDYAQNVKSVEQEPIIFIKKKKPHINESEKPGRPQKQRSNSQEVIVGGKYAEPPARYVNRVQSASVYSDDDEFDSNEYIDPDVAVSATMSPYVNYKNSNMAFSPQNLNDAFSIVEK